MKRLFWMGVGAAAGASGTVWAQRKVRSSIDELGAEQVVAAAGRGARAMGRSVRAAVSEGRAGMVEREIELKGRLFGTEASLDLRRDPGAGDPPLRVLRGSNASGVRRSAR
ncbi:MAG: hypothetical protein GY812_05485 [Actinomycetia bacterium]|nr:hypothetical protein [Actinomycetes bacterium]